MSIVDVNVMRSRTMLLLLLCSSFLLRKINLYDIQLLITLPPSPEQKPSIGCQ